MQSKSTPPPGPQHAGEERYGDVLDRAARALIANATRGVAPSVLAAAAADWAVHMVGSPGKQIDLWERALRGSTALAARALGVGEAAPVSDPRFRAEAWNQAPFAFLRDAFLLTRDWWEAATTDLRGMEPRSQRALNFAVHRWLDAVSPANNPFLNPEVLARGRETLGTSYVQGAMNLVSDIADAMRGKAPEHSGFEIGKDLAATPGRVVARNRLMELIQYAPTTGTVHPEPVLIVPAWIMKYYILDLSAHNSLVRWLVDQGFTVFMISWRNPDVEDRDCGMEGYLKMGPREAVGIVRGITGADQVHAVGYCLGGTLLAIAAADMAARGEDWLASMTLFAAQVDFSEVGELSLFISEAQVTMLEDMMWHQGVLDSDQMEGAFTMLRADDLYWSRIVRDYMLGERAAPIDLMVWNADATRMPYRMHSEYLRRLYLQNRLSQGKYRINGHVLSLGDLRLPIFAVGTETDHVAPWKSVFKIQHLTDTETTFVLTNGGHNAGILSEPGHPGRHYRIATTGREDLYLDADGWVAAHPPQEGSWWPAWGEWLAGRSGPRVPPPPIGGAEKKDLGPAPGTYVLQR